MKATRVTDTTGHGIQLVLSTPHEHRCQFYQNFTSSFFIQKCFFAEFYLLTIWLCNFFAERKPVQKLFIKCWGNWLQGASVLIPLHEHELRYPVVRGLNYGWREHLSWWYSGGIAIYPNSTTLQSSEILKSDKNWRYAPELPYVDGLNYHCKVQISDCETAVIGGFSQINLTIPTNVMTISNAVSWIFCTAETKLSIKLCNNFDYIMVITLKQFN